MKVLKFGGTSMANAESIKRVKDIVLSSPLNRFVVVSAPGKREATDTKVTDLLYKCYEKKKETGRCDEELAAVEKRFYDIASALGLKVDLSRYFHEIKNDIYSGASCDYVASRGEYLSAIITSAYLDMPFVDAAQIIKFDMSGNFEAELTNEICSHRLKSMTGAVIPGFYGQLHNGRIKTFSRGGSDITGSIVARAVNADMYENWTDVDGFMTCDPRIVKNSKLISVLSYKELRELSYMGANVLHSDSIFPVRKSDIPINIKNTFNPSASGTMIVPSKLLLSREYERKGIVTGIAGKKDFTAIYIEKSLMNNELGFARKVLSILERNNLSMEHMPSGIDTLTVVIDSSSIDPLVLKRVVADISIQCEPDNIEVVDNIAMIAIVGHGMNRKKGTAGRVFTALSKADVNIRMIDQGSSELNIIVGIESSDYVTAINALYNEFADK